MFLFLFSEKKKEPKKKSILEEMGESAEDILFLKVLLGSFSFKKSCAGFQ